LVLLSLLAQVGRDAGKRLEPALFQKWNGKPSIRKLRHRDTDLEWITLERLRSSLAAAVGVSCPTASEENADPAAADEVYSAYVDHLREATRGDAILLSENISYGFRRSLRGQRPAGIAVSIIGCVGAVIGMSLDWATAGMAVPLVVTAINAMLLAFWSLRVNDNWVKEAADAYADRLVRAFLTQKQEKTSAAA